MAEQMVQKFNDSVTFADENLGDTSQWPDVDALPCNEPTYTEAAGGNRVIGPARTTRWV